MNKLMEAIENDTNFTLTENMALTHKTTKSDVLDYFSMGSALRTREPISKFSLFSKARAENKELAYRSLFYSRDVRGGQGERQTFRDILAIALDNYAGEVLKVLKLIPEYGRWDDVVYLFDISSNAGVKNIISNFLHEQIEEDLKSDNPSLLAKWLPSINAGKDSKRVAKDLIVRWGVSASDYRKTLSFLRNKIDVVERKMSASKWGDIEYSHVPSNAGLLYRNAFLKHDYARYSEYLANVAKGTEKVNTGTLYPYDIVGKVFAGESSQYLDLAWKNLPNYVKEGEHAIVVADVSGSMYGLPLNVSISLALYFAERNKGAFQDYFMTFSSSPELVKVKGNTLYKKVINLSHAHWDMNTNLQKVFDLILKTAVSNHISEDEMLKKIYIVSDMEFDACAENATNFQEIKRKYAEAGYEMPELVFWNVDSRNNQSPITVNDEGVVLVSGCSPSILKNLMSGKKFSPYTLMLDVIMAERYNPVAEALK